MVQSQFALSWESHKSNICSGFSSFQQNGELVDMTLAADGHLVKVHQVLIALSSPYLKQLIVSVPSQHPVIFLNNVSHTTLSLVLEYIYTGEVRVPAENLSAFMEAARALHIRGLENVIDSCNKIEVDMDESNTSSVKKRSNIPDQMIIPPTARKVFVNVKHKDDTVGDTSTMIGRNKSSIGTNDDEDIHKYSITMDTTEPDFDDDFNDSLQTPNKNSDSNSQKTNKKSILKDKVTSSNLQFTVSIRGALQVILNRYIYNLHSTQSSGVRRWRCIDYRNKKCLAFVVTKGSIVLNRANPHNHLFHDKKILDKVEKDAIYSALDDVRELASKCKDKDKEKSTPVESEFIALDEFDSDSESKSRSCNKN